MLLALALAGAALSLLWRKPSEPVYQGRKLSAWCIQLSQSSSAEERTTAAEAIRQIGTNAFPQLLQWISYDPNPVIREAITNTLRSLDSQSLDSLGEAGEPATPP